MAEAIADAEERFLGSARYPSHDFIEPDFDPIYEDRNKRWTRCENDPAYLARLKAAYARNPRLFIEHWGMTKDPREAIQADADDEDFEDDDVSTLDLDAALEADMPLDAGDDFAPKEPTNYVDIPMVLFRKQEELVDWVWQKLREAARRRQDRKCVHGIVDKSRDCGATWIFVWLAVWALFFVPGFTFGFGSRKDEYIDNSKTYKAFFQRLIWSIGWVPYFLKPDGWNTEENYARKRIQNPWNGAGIVGEAGDAIGRGDRTTMTVVDEKAACRNQLAINKALSANTDCHIDVSTAGDPSDLYAEQKAEYEGTDKLFEVDYTDDPRKQDGWEEAKLDQVGQEVFDIEYGRKDSSDEEAFIPYSWITKCVDAHLKLGLQRAGPCKVGFDPADTGDAKGFTSMHGPIITEAVEMTGGEFKLGNLWAFQKALDCRADVMGFDADGLGVGVPTDRARPMKLPMVAFKGKAKVRNPRDPVRTPGGSMDFGRRRNARTVRRIGEFLGNMRAQAWWDFRIRVFNTYQAISALDRGEVIPSTYAPDDLISISSGCKHYRKLCRELSRPRQKKGPGRTLLVESKQEMRARKVKSPNIADSAIICNFTLPPALDSDPSDSKWQPVNILME